MSNDNTTGTGIALPFDPDLAIAELIETLVNTGMRSNGEDMAIVTKLMGLWCKSVFMQELCNEALREMSRDGKTGIEAVIGPEAIEALGEMGRHGAEPTMETVKGILDAADKAFSRKRPTESKKSDEKATKSSGRKRTSKTKKNAVDTSEFTVS